MAIKIERAEVISLIERHNKTRRHLGYGIDPYCSNEAHHYPMAYACFCIANCHLYAITHSPTYIDDAVECAGILDTIKSESEIGYCWGLPFSWREQPVGHPYTITTVFCADAFLSLYYHTKDIAYLDVINKISEWILQENMWHHFSKNLACPYYSPALRICVVNVASKTASFLLRAAATLEGKEKEALDSAKKAFNFVIGSQNRLGFWKYETKSNIIDNIHTAFILKGLIDYFKNFKDSRLKEVIKKGLSFYARYFFRQNYGIEKIELRNLDLRTITHFLKNGNKLPLFSSILFYIVNKSILFYHPKETRLWGYGAALTTFSEAKICGFKTDSNLKDIYHYVLNNLLNEDSRFFYKKDDNSLFVRHEAFAYLGLVSLLSILD